ncbi:MAG TPA: tetratricopeptide repeat protein [Thermoanaerobaculia bacterium]|nr:tetratricopeptide repeat protein [Thermoanaerobaculia bacterium]
MKRSFVVLALIATSLFAADDPTDAGGWFRRGIALHDTGDYQGALAAYEKAESMHFGQPFPLWLREARAFAKTGQADRAFETLKKLTDNGFANAEVLDAENDLLGIRLDPRYAQTIAAAKKNAHPCATPEHRAFDFWLGEWDVFVNGQKIAYSSIQLTLDECVIFENYNALRGYSGKSFSVFDGATKKWQQRYFDTTGAVHDWTGELTGGALRFLWNHDRQIDRMTYTKEGPDEVRQLIDTSTDGGKTWNVTFDGKYVRRK